MKTRVVEKPMEIEALIRIGAKGFGDMIKAGVDAEKKIMAVGGGELHAGGIFIELLS